MWGLLGSSRSPKHRRILNDYFDSSLVCYPNLANSSCQVWLSITKLKKRKRNVVQSLSPGHPSLTNLKPDFEEFFSFLKSPYLLDSNVGRWVPEGRQNRRGF
jgi:hypothetical protein